MGGSIKRGGSRLRDETGAALIELAVLLPLLLLLVLGIGDFGRGLYWGITLTHAARAGAQYGAQSIAKSADSSGIQQAAQNEAQNIGTISVSSAVVCQCPGGSNVSCTSTTCAGYGAPQVSVLVTTSTTFNTVAPWPGVPRTTALSRTATVRLQ